MFYLVSVLVLSLIGTSYFRVGRSFFVRHAHTLLASFFLVVFSYLLYTAGLLYIAWQYHPTGQFLLPPHQDIDYFLRYAGFRIFVPYVVSFLAAFLFFFAAKFLNRKYDGRFFELEEPYFLALSLFLVGHPGWLLYLVTVFVVYFLFHIIYALIANRTDRLPFYHFWLPVALFVILLSEFWLQHTELWSLLGFGKLQ